MTQKELLESLLSEIKYVKTNMPNGEFKQLQKDFEHVKEDISDLKYTLLNPEDGVIVNTNRNSEFRKEEVSRKREYENYISDLQDIKAWRSGVNKALWIIFGSLVAIVIRMLLLASETNI